MANDIETFFSRCEDLNLRGGLMRLKIVSALMLLAVVVVAYVILNGGDRLPGTGDLLDSSSGVPDPYYLSSKRADIYNPDDVIRYGSSIRSYTTNLDAFERAAFYEWYLKSHGFEDITFAYTEDFRDEGKRHLWLLVRTPKKEVIEVEPSYKEMGVSSLVPLNPEYTKYEREFGDIHEACRCLGAGKLDWWNDETAQQAVDDNLLLAKKEEAMRTVSK
jgi:hypothetical protein